MWTETDHTVTTEEVAIPVTLPLTHLHRRLAFNRYALLIACFLLLINGVFLWIVMYQLGR